jgi:hypothetical protein
MGLKKSDLIRSERVRPIPIESEIITSKKIFVFVSTVLILHLIHLNRFKSHIIRVWCR